MASTRRTLLIAAVAGAIAAPAWAASPVALPGDMTQGSPLSPPQREYLLHFGRPVFVASYRAEGAGRLAALYGPALFQNTEVSVFGLAETQAARR